MPRAKKITTEYIESDRERDERPMESIHDPAEDTYDQFVGRFGGEGVRIKVYRQTERSRQYCFWGLPSDVDEEAIRLYHANQSYAHEQGTYIVVAEVHGEQRNSFTISIAPQISTPGAQSGGMASQSNDLLLKMLMDQNARLEQRLLNNHPQEREPINDLADAMLKLSQLQQVNKPELPIDTLMKCIELGKSLDGGGDWKTELLAVVKESMPAIQTMLSAKPANPNVPQNPNPLPAQNEAMMLQQQLKDGIVWLKRKAIAGSDPGLYIDWVIDNRETAPYAQLIHSVLSQPFSAFAQIDSEISQPPYETFFVALYDGIRSAFEEPDSTNVDSGRPSGDTPNTKSNGKAGKGSGKQSHIS